MLSAVGPGELELPAGLATLVKTGRWANTPAGFRVIALSNLADGCAAQARVHPERKAAALRCIERAWELAEAVKTSGRGMHPDGIVASHRALILGAHDALGECLDPRRHAALAEQLARASLRDPFAHLGSYRESPARWPADQTATLAALTRYDRAHAALLLPPVLAQWRIQIATHGLDAATGLPVSDISGTSPHAKSPRGCALSFSTRYLAEVDPVLAHAWWKRYRSQYLVRLPGVVGFREWPPGMDGPADSDSGPIILGIGVAASGLAIAAARSQKDDMLAQELETSAGWATTLSRSAARAAQAPLAQAIRFQARWQQPALDSH